MKSIFVCLALMLTIQYASTHEHNVQFSVVVQDNNADLEKCLLQDVGSLLSDVKALIDTRDIANIGAVLKDLYNAFEDCKKLLPATELLALPKAANCQDALFTMVGHIKDTLVKALHGQCDTACLQNAY
jgi:hypothetical protein